MASEYFKRSEKWSLAVLRAGRGMEGRGEGVGGAGASSRVGELSSLEVDSVAAYDGAS